MDAVADLGRFSRAVKLTAFHPFESAVDALANANAISEHAMTDSLRTFLELNLPQVSAKKKKKSSQTFRLGVLDSTLATAISGGMSATGNAVSCRSDDTIREIVRGCRIHLSHYVKGLDATAQTQAQLGLGHSYSRAKVKFNPARSDNMVIQTIAILDQLDKDLNTFAMRIREWYSWHFPELRDLVKDNYMFARCAAFIQDKSSLLSSSNKEDDGEDEEVEESSSSVSKKDKLASLTEIVGDEELARAVIAAAKSSMGVDCSVVDMVNIVNFTQRMVRLAEYRAKLAKYLTDKMSIVAPNLSALIGDSVAARLISKAGSLTNLAKSPASTVQILGAEKALFRALKTKGNTPKYGLIYHSTFIGRADAKNKGRISRYLANKCSIATRIDSFSDEPNPAYGLKLREQVEERLQFYQTGASPRKNIDVMTQVAKELAAATAPTKKDNDGDVEMEEKGTKKKKKKDKKKKGDDNGKSNEEEDVAMEVDDDDDNVEKSAKKKKKDKKAKKRKAEGNEEDEDGGNDNDENVEKTKKSKKAAKKTKRDSEVPAETPRKIEDDNGDSNEEQDPGFSTPSPKKRESEADSSKKSSSKKDKKKKKRKSKG